MDKDVRNRIQRATQEVRALLEREFGEQLEGLFDIRMNGVIAPEAGPHLTPRKRLLRAKLIASVEHFRSGGASPSEAVARYQRDAAFTTLNRFVALKMLEARQLLQECVSRGDQSAGFREFVGLAPGLAQMPDHGYRLYIESIFDEIGREVGVLFDRRDPASLLWPRRNTLRELLATLNAADLADVWAQDETIGWVYQFFNSGDERRQMREESQAPRNSRELAVRNQFFTPRYVVQFLTENTLGRSWFQMRSGDTALADRWEYFVRDEGVAVRREIKDPRDLKILDPACGSGHFLLYAFDLLLDMYEEAWGDPQQPRSEAGTTLREDYGDVPSLRRSLPALIVQHNLHGVEIDPRAAQITALALWLRAQRAYKEFNVTPTERMPITQTHIVIAEPMPGDHAMVDDFAAGLEPPLLRDLFRKMIGEMTLAGELGSLLQVERAIAAELHRAREQFVRERSETKPRLPGLEPERRQGELDLSGVDDDAFFHEAETLIVDALRRFAESTTGEAGVRRRLFAGDAAQGVALIELLRMRFDVVLMNPPFGAGSVIAKQAFDKAYPRTKNDLYAAFVERGIQLLHERGMLGAITSRTGFFLSSFQKWREEILLEEAPPTVFADLGYGVLDGAMVEVAAYCLEVAA